ncbi:MAG: hypothetical protein M1833_005927 [Piccolia ochrophora]|nr:MAG: hypothetical protein M1833_005927 [Piccolia ochrophora]
MASPATAGASGNNSSGVKHQAKGNPGSRSSDQSRKQAGSPIDGPQSQKAWTQGTNPITQRNSSFTQANGSVSQAKGATKTGSSSTKENTEDNIADKHADDRLLFLFANFLGKNTTVTVTNGDTYEGIFSGSSFEPGELAYVLKMVKYTKSSKDQEPNGVTDSAPEYVGTGGEYTMVFGIRDVVDLAVEGVSFSDSPAPAKIPNGAPSKFQTDTDISGNLAMRERNLQRWEPSADTDVDLSLETVQKAPGPVGSWDQFEANERLYGVKSDYDENYYTTVIDKNNPQYRQREARAERIAREIEGGITSNPHVAEERGRVHGDDSGVNEEDKYSGVDRGTADAAPLTLGSINKYTPPARRAPTGKPTVAGAPFDPAIISSQIATPESMASRQGKQVAQQVQGASVSSPQKADDDNVPIDSQATARPALPDETISAKKPTSTVKTLTESTQRQAASGITAGPNGSSSPYAKPPGANATATVENDVRDAFRQFASSEKMRYQERRRQHAKADKDIKLNDLMKFSKNFKLNTPVPKDLVPILAKDKDKQELIVEKAQKAAHEAAEDPPTSRGKVVPTDTKSLRQSPTTKFDPTSAPSQTVADRQTGPRGRSGHPSHPVYPTNPRQFVPSNVAIPGRPRPELSQRLANLQHQNKTGAPAPAIPSPVPIHEGRIPPTGPAAISTDIAAAHKYNGAPTPSSASSTKFNVKALEFRPNPNAISFTPTGEPSNASSPQSSNNARPASRHPTPSQFFGSKKITHKSEKRLSKDSFNPIARFRKEAQGSKEELTSTGGVPPPHRTAPRWDVHEDNKEKSYTEMFDKVPFSTHSMSPQHQHATPQLPHQHQLPFHLQHGGMPPGAAQHHGQHHLHPPQQPHYAMGLPQQFDEHRMQISSSSPSVLPSPRLQHANMSYQSPMGQHAQLVYGQPMPPYNAGPGGPHLARQYSSGPHFVPQHGGQMGAPMMAHMPSNGPFMGMPQGMPTHFQQPMAMYSPNHVQAYPQHGGPPPPPPGSSGYPSPGRGAPMMMHQGSHQGQAQHPVMMYGMSPGQHHQPLYAPQPPNQVSNMRGGYAAPHQHQYMGSPHQGHHVPHHQHRSGPGNNYGQPPHGHAHGPASHGPPAAVAQNVGPDGHEDVK